MCVLINKNDIPNAPITSNLLPKIAHDVKILALVLPEIMYTSLKKTHKTVKSIMQSSLYSSKKR